MKLCEAGLNQGLDDVVLGDRELRTWLLNALLALGMLVTVSLYLVSPPELGASGGTGGPDGRGGEVEVVSFLG